MKYFFLVIIVLLSVGVSAQNNCSDFYPSGEGKTYVVHHFNKKDKLTSITESTITDVSSDGLKVKSEVKEDDGDSIVVGTYDVKCDGENTWIEPEALVSPGLMEQYQNMEYSISGNGLQIPNSLTVGQSLPDGEVLMSVDAGVMKMNVSIVMTDREVVRKESVTTDAGTFDCFVITYSNTIEMGIRKTYNCTQWIAQGVGMVKEESYKQNGKRMSKSLLQQIK
ncbi:hypothetical protein [Aquimarina brevivitae]|uniref:DUF3108 domain-containing protein n=1 Tax=Aquimarina brevivitae TaxID=323412 RepID=A0A4Q7P276_9FLAO|nr:hypothetical protein [Aquimarina brevivitae]RZS93438.1 hypothetical protein EV197_2016 [Aquimarina brevivitae]